MDRETAARIDLTLFYPPSNPMESPATSSRELLEDLGRRRLRLRRGRFVAGLGFVVAGAIVFVLLAGLSDFVAGWEAPVRLGLVGAGSGMIALAVAYAWSRASATPLSEVARRTDDHLGDPRRSLHAALDLSRENDAESSPLHRYLADLAMAKASKRAAAMPEASLLGDRERWIPWRRALLALLALVLIAVLHPRAASVVGFRLLCPWGELAPYSPWQFHFSEASAPRVIFGKDVDLTVAVEGPAFSRPVELLLRPVNGGETERLPTFRESGTRYTRKLEGVNRPLEYAFALGRARSGWRPLEILYQPRLERAVIDTVPPPYSRLTGSRFELGGGDLRVLRGTEVRLTATSNRPLSGGTLEGRSPNGGEVLRRIEGAVTTDGKTEADGRRADFAWRVEEDLVWTLDLVDVRGGRMEEPVLFVQQLVPDEKPEISNIEPGPFVFATPDSEVRLTWEIRDDFGLDRIDLARSSGRFRERTVPLSGGAGEKQIRLDRHILLADLGVRPGQSLEYLVEARDRNPSLLGVSVSPATKVNIISEEEYAEAIRLRTTLEEFSSRYRALRETLEAVLGSLEALSTAAAGPAAEAAKAKTIAAHRRALEWFTAFASDFPAFGTDAVLNQLSDGLASELEANLAELDTEGATDDPAAIADLARQLAERLRPGAGKLADEAAEAERLAAVAGVMEMAAELEAIRNEQREITESLGRLAREMALGITDNRGDVPALRARQMRNRERLARVEADLPERIAGLPESAGTLGEGAGKVLQQLRALEVGGQMETGVRQAGEGKVPGAADSAALALANLEQILGGDDDDFTRICNGGEPGFCSGEGVAARTLAQMLAALRTRALASGNQPGAGGGGSDTAGAAFGAMGGSGASMQGIQLNIPLLGPPRVSLANPPGGGGIATDSADSGEASVVHEAGEAETLPRGDSAEPGGKGWNPEEVPVKYRAAVTRFYSDETINPDEPATLDKNARPSTSAPP